MRGAAVAPDNPPSQAYTGSESSEDAEEHVAADASEAGARSSRHKMLCQVQGCSANPATGGKYCMKRRLCPAHIKADSVLRRHHGNQLFRFCQQCGKLEPLSCFDGIKRSCRVQLARRREASNKSSAAKKRARTSSGGGAGSTSISAAAGASLSDDPQIQYCLHQLQHLQQVVHHQLAQQQGGVADTSAAAAAAGMSGYQTPWGPLNAAAYNPSLLAMASSSSSPDAANLMQLELRLQELQQQVLAAAAAGQEGMAQQLLQQHAAAAAAMLPTVGPVARSSNASSMHGFLPQLAAATTNNAMFDGSSYSRGSGSGAVVAAAVNTATAAAAVSDELEERRPAGTGHYMQQIVHSSGIVQAPPVAAAAGAAGADAVTAYQGFNAGAAVAAGGQQAASEAAAAALGPKPDLEPDQPENDSFMDVLQQIPSATLTDSFDGLAEILKAALKESQSRQQLQLQLQQQLLAASAASQTGTAGVSPFAAAATGSSWKAGPAGSEFDANPADRTMKEIDVKAITAEAEAAAAAAAAAGGKNRMAPGYQTTHTPAAMFKAAAEVATSAAATAAAAQPEAGGTPQYQYGTAAAASGEAAAPGAAAAAVASGTAAASGAAAAPGAAVGTQRSLLPSGIARGATMEVCAAFPAALPGGEADCDSMIDALQMQKSMAAPDSFDTMPDDLEAVLADIMGQAAATKQQQEQVQQQQQQQRILPVWEPPRSVLAPRSTGGTVQHGTGAAAASPAAAVPVAAPHGRHAVQPFDSGTTMMSMDGVAVASAAAPAAAAWAPAAVSLDCDGWELGWK